MPMMITFAKAEQGKLPPKLKTFVLWWPASKTGLGHFYLGFKTTSMSPVHYYKGTLCGAKEPPALEGVPHEDCQTCKTLSLKHIQVSIRAMLNGTLEKQLDYNADQIGRSGFDVMRWQDL